MTGKQGHAWRPATEFTVRGGGEPLARACWTTKRAAEIADTADPELYQYGLHATAFTVNVTVGPGQYHVRLKFAETQHTEANKRAVSIYLNDKLAAERMDVFATAGGANKAVDLVFNDVAPQNGVIEVRLVGERIGKQQTVAILQALEVGPGSDGQGAKVVMANP